MSTLRKSFPRAAKLVILWAAAGAAILLIGCDQAVPEPAQTPTTPQQPTDPTSPQQPTDPEPTPPPEPSVDRGLGLQFMDDQAYRSAYVLRAEPVSVPSSVDLSADNPPPGDQGRQGSCVGWAVAYAMKSYQERIERGWPLTDNGHVFSPAYVYNQIKAPGGGAYFFDAFSLLVDQGVASYATMPYNPNDDRRQPSATARREAADYKIADWGTVLRTSHATFVQEIKRHLAANTPVVIGIHTYPDFFNLNPANPVYEDASGFSRGGHAIVIVGYDDARSAFKIINSWGTGWGIDGYGWIDYDASEQLIRVAYTADDVVAADVNRRPEAASTPVPDNTADGVATGDAATTLSWTRNERTTSFDVYVGTDSELGAVDFQGNVAQPTFSARLAPGSTYYWRIDARGAGGLTQGPVWSFTTAGSAEPPLKPTNPRPTNGATVVSGGVSLSWDSGGRATSYDVYLGTDSSLGSSDLQRTQAVRAFYPGTLVAGTRYYWRIDAKNGRGTTRGDTWSFTTAGPARTLSIADASATEGQSLNFVVTLSAASASAVTVGYRTANATASSSDYTSTSGTLRFAAGETRKTISVRTTDDRLKENNETITVTLSSARGATISDVRAIGTIIDASSDHGDSRSTAHVLSNCGSGNRDWTINGDLTAGDKDYFKIVCNDARGTLTAWTTGSTDTYGDLLDSNGNRATGCARTDQSSRDHCVSNNDGSGRNFRISRSATVGTYYLEVKGTFGDTGPYVLRVRWRPGDTSDHGDSRSTAHVLSNCGSGNRDWTINGSLTAGDKDYFKIVCNDARGTLTAWTTGSTDTYGDLLDSNGNRATGCARTDQSSRDHCVSNNDGSGRNFRISRSATVGTYYLEVKGTFGDTGPYVLRVQWRPGDTSDHGDSRSTAHELSNCGSGNRDWTINGSLTADDQDYFVIECNARRGALTAWTTGSTDTYGEFLTGDGTRIERDEDSGSGNNFYLSEQTAAVGGYYLKVKGDSSSTTGPYVLRVRWRPYDISDSFSSATEIRLRNTSRSYPGYLHSNDVDWFKFNPGSGGRCIDVHIWSTLDHRHRPFFDTDPAGALFQYTSGLHKLLEHDNRNDQDPDFEMRNVRLRKSGHSFGIRVQLGSSAETGPYTLYYRSSNASNCSGALN